MTSGLSHSHMLGKCGGDQFISALWNGMANCSGAFQDHGE